MPRFMTYKPANMLFAAATATAADPAFALLSAEAQATLTLALKESNKAIKEREAHQGVIASARKEYSMDGIEIDDDPVTSLSYYGAWSQPGSGFRPRALPDRTPHTPSKVAAVLKLRDVGILIPG